MIEANYYCYMKIPLGSDVLGRLDTDPLGAKEIGVYHYCRFQARLKEC